MELPFVSREPGVFPNELDLSIDELLVSFNGLGPVDTDCVRGVRSLTPNSDVLDIFLSDGIALNVRPGVCGREGCDRRVGSDCVIGESLGGKGGGSISSSSRVEGNRVLADEAVLRLLLLTEDCLVQVPSVETMLRALERGEGPTADCDFREANEDVLERAIDESRRVSGDGESSSSLYARRCENRGRRNPGGSRTFTYLSLHPSPVVRPMPPRKSLPSLCLVRRLRVSRSSLNRPAFVFIDAKTLSQKPPTEKGVQDVLTS